MKPPYWILTDDEFMKPSYRISPFCTSSIALNSQFENNNSCDAYFVSRFSEYQHQYLLKARHGITLALQSLFLEKTDHVAVLTTTGNLYISGCVTRAIEAVCSWTRSINDETKAIIVIHEFGKIYSDLNDLYELGIPIIEDFAHSFNSVSDTLGRSDYIIYSFPKYFPIQFGGLILSKKAVARDVELSSQQEGYIKNVISAYLVDVDSISKKRWLNYLYLAKAFSLRSMMPRFDYDLSETPSVFMFRAPNDVDLPELKSFMQTRGVECSVFYGEQAFFVPCHDRLTAVDLDYFIYLYDVFTSESYV